MINPATYTEVLPSSTNWSRTGGIDSNIPLYNDSTISYSDSATYYNGYNGNTTTVDDVKFSVFTEAGSVAKSAYTDVT